MKLFTTAATLLAATLAVSASTLDVWAPKILSPKAGDVWASGERRTVTWDLSSKPVNVTNPIGIVALWDNGIPTPVILAYNFQLTDGHVRVKVPDVFSGDDFALVLIGDGGNVSENFTIKGVVDS